MRLVCDSNTCTNLKQLLREHGCSTGGNKEELVERLLALNEQRMRPRLPMLVPQAVLPSTSELMWRIMASHSAVPPGIRLNTSAAQIEAAYREFWRLQYPPTSQRRISVLKCGLRTAMNLSDAEYALFQGRVEGMVWTISRMMRRATLLLSYACTRALEEDAINPAPDKPPLRIKNFLDKKATNDTYWKRWLQLGPPPPADPAATSKGGTNAAKSKSVAAGVKYPCPDTEALLAGFPVESVYLCESPRPNATDNEAWAKAECMLDKQPALFDQVLCYAAGSLRTMVCNTIWVKLVEQIARYVRTVVKRAYAAGGALHGTDRVSWFRVWNALRSGNEELLSALPQHLQPVCVEVRNQLGLESGAYLDDKVGKRSTAFATTMRFRYWLQQRFEALGGRGMKLMPVAKVAACHVRLDQRTLLGLAKELFPGRQAVAEWVAADAEVTRATPAAVHAVMQSKGWSLEDLLPAPDLQREPGETDEELASRQQEQRKSAALIVEECKACLPDPRQLTPWLEKIAVLGDIRAAAVASLVNPKLRMQKASSFDGMLVTDGVAASVQFSRIVQQPLPRLRKTERGKKPTPQESSDCCHGESTIVDALVTNLASLGLKEGDGAQTVAVLGLDPGRCVIATVVLVDLQGKTHTWRLTRGAFHSRSGVHAHTRKRTCRLGPDLVKKLCDLGAKDGAAAAAVANGGEDQEAEKEPEAQESEPVTGVEARLYAAALRTSKSSEVLRYATRTMEILPAWWRAGLRRTERRSKLGVLSGKRSVLDSFVAKVLREATAVLAKDDRLKDRRPTLQVAYGEAGVSMSASGKGELAVPTTGMFKAVKRVCKAASALSRTSPAAPRCLPVHVTDEWGTTKYDLETGEVKRKVYRMPTLNTTADGKLELHAVAMPCEPAKDGTCGEPPPVPAAEQRAVALWRKREHWIAVRRRGGGGGGGGKDKTAGLQNGSLGIGKVRTSRAKLWDMQAASEALTDEELKKAVQYPEVRGLQANKAGKFVARDKASAAAIAMCRVRELQGRGRPAAFCRSRDEKKSSVATNGMQCA